MATSQESALDLRNFLSASLERNRGYAAKYFVQKKSKENVQKVQFCFVMLTGKNVASWAKSDRLPKDLPSISSLVKMT